MTRGMKSILGAALAAGLALGAGGAAQALECPALQSLDGSGATPDLKEQLASKDVLKQLPGVIGALHDQFPKASKAQLVNYVIAAYCPVVKADAALSGEEQMAKVKEFADKAIAYAY
jgi:hypothetical protein